MKKLPSRSWCYYENVGGGQNIRLTPIEDEEIGPKIGWVSYMFMFNRPKLVPQFLQQVYTKHYKQIYNRGIKQLVYNLFKKYDIHNFKKRYKQ